MEAAVLFDHMHRPQLFVFVSKGIVTFVPIDPNGYPERWSAGRYRVKKYLFGVVPMGWQEIGIETLPDQDQMHRLRDDGRGWLIPTWDHMIEIEPAAGGTRYVDRVRIDAGVLTPVRGGVRAPLLSSQTAASGQACCTRFRLCGMLTKGACDAPEQAVGTAGPFDGIFGRYCDL